MEIYKDATVHIQTPQEPATKGHIVITSEKQDINQITEEDFAEIFSAASFASTVLFEQAEAQGTNIFIDDINKGTQANVLARTEGDNISFQWKAKEYGQGEIDSYCAKIKDKCDIVNYAADKKQETETRERKEGGRKDSGVERTSEKRSTLGVQKDKNYLIEQLNRLP